MNPRMIAFALILGGATWSAPILAQSEHAPAAKSISDTASILRSAGGNAPWKAVAKGEAIPAGDVIVGLPGATLESKNGRVHLLLLADLDQQSPYPILEAAVRLHDAKDVDLDVTLDRGRVDLVNARTEGAVKVRIRAPHHGVQGEHATEVTLVEPGTRLALEIYGRWGKGVPFLKTPPPTHRPTVDTLALVVKGRVDVKHGRHHFLMKEPPGPSLVTRTLGDEEDPVPQSVETLPAWALGSGERSKSLAPQLEKLREAIVATSVEKAIDTMLSSEDPNGRSIGLVMLGATDNIQRLGQTIRETKLADVWERGVLVMRHWLGRAPGHDQKLYNILIGVRKMKPAHAETVMQMMHSFSDEDLGRPETYETLIGYLDHEELPIRGLAHWHLVRLAPQGREFGYLPTAAKEEREAARKKWMALIPAGKLPPKK